MNFPKFYLSSQSNQLSSKREMKQTCLLHFRHSADFPKPHNLDTQHPQTMFFTINQPQDHIQSLLVQKYDLGGHLTKVAK